MIYFVPAWDETAVKDMISHYYSRLFPFEAMQKWLSYGDLDYFGRREFSFTLQGGIYSRYNCFGSLEQFRNEVCKKSPQKIDIGAVYNTSPAHHARVQQFEPLEKEMVFDIDATDYADVLLETEPGSSLTSTRTWPWMVVCVQVLDHVLRNDFGFKHVLFVYSGRRGVHCWVADRRARQMSNSARSAIVDYLHVLVGSSAGEGGGSGGAQQVLQSLRSPLHPTLQWAYDKVLLPMFEDTIVTEQHLLTRPNHIDRVLSFASSDARQAALRKWAANEPPANASKDVLSRISAERWQSVRATLEKEFMSNGAMRGYANPVQAVVFSYTYPRLDVNVSKQLNHLLKSPFVIHPSTGFVCVPFTAQQAPDFKPEDVPAVGALLNELDTVKGDASRTKLQPYVDLFIRAFVEPLNREEQIARNVKPERTVKDEGDHMQVDDW